MILPLEAIPPSIPATILLQLGESGENEVVEAGVIVFGIVGVACLYLYYKSEMETGSVIRNLGYGCLVLALLSLIWPVRPWLT